MGTFNINLGKDTQLNLILGQQLENEVTEVVFDFSAWQSAYGSGTVGLSVQRHGDDRPYAVVPTVSGTDATWNISDLDTACKGVGEVQVTYTVGTVIKKSVVYKFTVYRSLGENGEYPSPGQTWQEEIEAELTNVKADLNDLKNKGAGLTESQKELIIAIMRAGVYSSDQSTNIDTLEELFTSTAVSITAVFDSQGNTIYSDDSLDTLKQYLTVVATFEDGTTGRITNYALSGSLTVGTATITVSYQEVLTTFTVSVSQAVVRYTITNTLTNVSNSNPAVTIPEGNTYTAVLSTSLESYAVSDVTIMMGGNNITSTAYDDSDNSITISNVTGNIEITASASYDTSPIVVQEDKYWPPSLTPTTKAGYGITKWYEYAFDQDVLESSRYWDAEHGYMNNNLWTLKIMHYLPNTKTVAAGYPAPGGANSAKNVWGIDGTPKSYQSFTWEVEGGYNLPRYSVDAVNSNNMSFTVALLDLDDSYAYWGSTGANLILPEGVDPGDIIFAGKNTKYYGMKNINEYTGE